MRGSPDTLTRLSMLPSIPSPPFPCVFNLNFALTQSEEPKPTRPTIGAEATPRNMSIPALRLVRDDELVEEPVEVPPAFPPPQTVTDRAVAAMVDRLRPTLAALALAVTEPPSPYGSALQVGTLEKFQDLHGGGSRVAYVYHGIGGEDIIVSFPMRGDTRAAARAVEDVVERINGQLYPEN